MCIRDRYNTIKDSEDPKDQAIAAELLKQLNVGEAELKANIETVSYTHLDVYKRQPENTAERDAVLEAVKAL